MPPTHDGNLPIFHGLCQRLEQVPVAEFARIRVRHARPRIQLAAAATVAQLDAGWEDSIRREVLYSVLHGPQDWATEAAIRVLTHLSCDYEPIAPDIHEAFQLLANHRPDAGYWSWERTLYSSWQQLPHLFPKEREEMRRIVDEMDAHEQSRNPG